MLGYTPEPMADDTTSDAPRPGAALFEGKSPKEIRSILKSDQPLTEDEARASFGWAYPGLDLTDPKTAASLTDMQTRTLDLTSRRLSALREREREAIALARHEDIETAKGYLAQQGFDPTLFPDDDLARIGHEFAIALQSNAQANHDALGKGVDVPYPSEESAVADMVSIDEETGAYYTANGEIVGYRTEGGSVEEILALAGERIAGADAQLAGKERAKQVWVDRVNAAHDPEIAKLRRLGDWLRATYLPLATRHLDALNERLPEDKRKRSLKVGLLTIQMGKTSPSVEVENDAKVIAALRALALDPESGVTGEMVERFVNRKETVAKSGFTEEDKGLLAEIDVPGLAFKRGGQDTYKLK